MNNLSNERASDKDIQQIIDSKEKGTTMFMPVDVYYLIAKELKALREDGKEPVGYVRTSILRECGGAYISTDVDAFGESINHTPLYAAPQLPAVPDGWVMVPTEATSAMLEEICLSKGWQEKALQVRYAAMIAAAPKPE